MDSARGCSSSSSSSTVADKTLATERSDSHCARAFYSNDFEWESLRKEIEDSRPRKCETAELAVTHESGDDANCLSGSWEAFHKNHSKLLFFKERRYLLKEFPELLPSSAPVSILELGCGTGSSVVPILRGNQYATVYGCDCSVAALERATELVTKQAGLTDLQIHSFRPFLCDISLESLPTWLCCHSCRKQEEERDCQQPDDDMAVVGKCRDKLFPFQPSGNCCLGGVHVVTLLFTLSAIPLESMEHVVAEASAVLRPGGWLLFRDYGLYDMTMLRFPLSQKIFDKQYRRKDGTLSYYFTLQVLRDLFTKVGLVEDELHYCCVQLRNRRKQVPMKRVWTCCKGHLSGKGRKAGAGTLGEVSTVTNRREQVFQAFWQFTKFGGRRHPSMDRCYVTASAGDLGMK